MTDSAKKQMAKAYEPSVVEQKWYPFWEEKGYFTPEIDPEREPFTIIMPPSNVTGELHLGHALVMSIEDTFTRWHRMLGDVTLWLPGTDHAGIAGQYVVEKELAKEGLTRHDLGREEFLKRVWDWMDKYGGIIDQQIRRLGASCDWTREQFTMGERSSRAVRETFKRLYDDGLIYRGAYLINWCPRCTTSLSDLEVVHQDEAAKIYYVRYPLADGSGSIEIATTRPETMLGDTAIAVNPADERYKDLVGKRAILPLVGREIPIVADEVVEVGFGTGAVKVTPGHDPNDFEIGRRHGLPSINVLNLNGTLNDEAREFAGLTIAQARDAVVRALEEGGYLVKADNYNHSVGHCIRCGEITEPLISTQWFLKTESLAKPAIDAVVDGRIKFVPERFTKVYLNWMENIRDWCISRQLWWGHRIPVWYCEECEEITVSVEEKVDHCQKCGCTRITQDPDVLDTWFSSALWPHSTLGWPEDTQDLRYFYPTTLMETGYDILFFWVARMVMLGMYNTGDIPFEWVYLHGLVRDPYGQKMSKTKGNVVDPLRVIDEYGTDALRFTLISGGTPGNDQRLSPEKLQGSRNFANKIWNVTRFILGAADMSAVPWDEAGRRHAIKSAQLELSDRWIISRHNTLIADVSRLMRAFQIGEACRYIQDFFWSELADWYVESAKSRLYGEDPAEKSTASLVLATVVERSVRLLHPFMPFLTEEIWQNLPHEGESIMVAPWPQAWESDAEAEKDFGLIMEIVRAVRNARAESGVEPARWIEAEIVSGSATPVISSQRDEISRLARIDINKLRIVESRSESYPQAIALVTGEVVTYLPLAGLVDVEEERARLSKEFEETQRLIERSEALLANPGFAGRAPESVVSKEREKLEAAKEKAARLSERLSSLG